MAQTVTPTMSQVMTDLVNFVQSVIGSNIPVIQGIQNRAAAPLPMPGFVVLTPLFQDRLSFNVDTWPTTGSPSTQTQQQSRRMDVQVDCYGPSAGDWASMLSTLFNDEYACDIMVNSQPLYMNEARMMPLIDSEAQYEQRFCLTAALQYNPVVQPAQEFADALDITLIDVNVQYPV
jgi:hypothetical protein